MGSALTTDPIATYLTVLAVLAVLYATLGRWLYRDASRRGSEWARQWATGIPALLFLGLVPGLLVLIIYLLVRGDELEGPESEADARGS